MKTNILTFITIATTIFLASCEKEIEFKGEQIDPKLVINSIVEPGQPVKAYISKSIFFLDNDSNMQAPDDVVATLYVNGNRIGELTRQPDTVWTGYEYVDMDSVKPVYKIVPAFVSGYCPNEGDVVKITASANGFDEVEGSTSPVPNAVTWSLGDCQTKLWEVSFEEYEGDTIWTIMGQLELTVEIADPNPGQTDYFKIHLENDGYSDYDSGNSFYISTSYDDPVFGANVSDNDYINIDFQSRPEGVFTDMLFDGRSYQIKLPLYLYFTLWEDFDEDFFQISVSLQHLSKEYYYYLNTCEQGSEIDQFFAEPVQTYTNVNGGYGIVAAHTVDTVWMELPLYSSVTRDVLP